jgi:diketogulonate reductase-like aldo/keto reductase
LLAVEEVQDEAWQANSLQSLDVLLRWCIQHDIRSSRSRRTASELRRTASAFDFALSDEDIAHLDELDSTGGTDHAVERAWW